MAHERFRVFLGWRHQVDYLDAVRGRPATEMACVLKRSPMPRSTKPMKKTRATSAAKLKRDALKAWGAYIHARDQVCQYCGKADGKLDAHHVVIRRFAATCTDETNGILLCYAHHQLMHSDPMAAVKFYTMRFMPEGYERLRQKAYDGINGRYGVDYWRGEIERLRKLLEATHE